MARTGASSRLRTISAIKLFIEDPLGVLLGLLRGVGIVEVGLVTASNLSFSGHCGGVGGPGGVLVMLIGDGT